MEHRHTQTKGSPETSAPGLYSAKSANRYDLIVAMHSSFLILQAVQNEISARPQAAHETQLIEFK
jgi:hypothetical protein